MFFKPGYKGNPIKEFEELYQREFEKELKGPFRSPKESICREAPGQMRRQAKKDALRNADYRKIKDIVSGIFAQKQIRYPPTTLRDLGWDKKFKE
jgi:hypothetical protein